MLDLFIGVRCLFPDGHKIIWEKGRQSTQPILSSYLQNIIIIYLIKSWQKLLFNIHKYNLKVENVSFELEHKLIGRKLIS